MLRADVAVLACPACRGALEFHGLHVRGEALDLGHLHCRDCRRTWPVRAGIPHLFDDSRVRGSDRLLRLVYDCIAPLHDAAARFVLPLAQGSSIATTRDAYMARLELGDLQPRPEGAPLRILEVGVGAGANLPLIERDLPLDLDVELWGLDLSAGMLAQCRRRLACHHGRRVRLLLADAHSLPFPDASFDRVFHVGGVAGYHDPRRALAEMARVARPQTPIVVVDEQLDPGRSHGLYYRLQFRALTIYDPDPRAPRDELPENAIGVVEEPASRFYYCLTFRMPDPGATPAAPGPRPQRNAARKDDRTMLTVKDILSDQDLAQLKSAYDPEETRKVLGAFFPAVYPLSGDYVTAVTVAFFGDRPRDTPQPRSVLSAPDRERCLIAILADRGADLNLAIHFYLALVNDVSPEEIANILFLVGIYTGVDNMAETLKAEIKTLRTLRTLVCDRESLRPLDVVTRLQREFEG